MTSCIGTKKTGEDKTERMKRKTLPKFRREEVVAGGRPADVEMATKISNLGTFLSKGRV